MQSKVALSKTVAASHYRARHMIACRSHLKIYMSSIPRRIVTLKMPPKGDAPKPITETSMPVFPRGRFGICMASISMQYSLGPLCNRFTPRESKCLPSRLGGLCSEEGVNTLQTDARAATTNQYPTMLANVFGNIAYIGTAPVKRVESRRKLPPRVISTCVTRLIEMNIGVSCCCSGRPLLSFLHAES